MFHHSEFVILTEKYLQMVVITNKVREVVDESGIQNGLVAVISLHTTTGISVNESLECLDSDIEEFLGRLVPEDHPYSHARILPSYGSTAGNPTGHIKAMLTGNHCLFPIVNGEMVIGAAQEIYLYEFDGPAKRTVTIMVQGE